MKALNVRSDPDGMAKSNPKLRHINLLLSWRSRLLLKQHSEPRLTKALD